MKRFAVLALSFVALLLLAVGLSAQEEKPHWKALQVKHFTLNPGVNFPQEDLGYFYEGVLEKLRKGKLTEQVLDDAATVPPADAANSIVMEGAVTHYEQGHFISPSHVHMEFKLYRVSDHRLITTVTWNEDRLKPIHGNAWRQVGPYPVHEIEKATKDLQPLASYPPAPPSEAKAPAAAVPAAPPSEVLTNQSVLDMVAQKIPEEVIITKIQTFPNQFDLSNSALSDLTQKGISPAIMKAMLTAPKAGPAPAPAPPGTPALAAAAPNLPLTPHREGPHGVAEVRRFTIAEGVQLPGTINPPNFLTLLAEQVRADLLKKRISEQAVVEGATVPEADAASAIVVEGRITATRLGFHTMADPPRLTMEIKVYWRSDHVPIATTTPTLKMLGGWYSNDDRFSKIIGEWVVEEIQKAMK